MGYIVTLDTNVWLNFVSVQFKLNEQTNLPRSLKRSDDLMKLWLSSKFVSTISKWGLWELRDQLIKVYLQIKFIESGYVVTEFSDAKKEIELSNSETDAIEEILKVIKKGSIYKNSRLISDVIEYFNSVGISCMDSIILFQSLWHGNCRYLVTRDKPLIKSYNIIRNEFGIERKSFDVISMREFLGKVG